MAMNLECIKCKKNHRYYEDEIENIGTILNPVWVAFCPHCGEKLTSQKDLPEPKENSSVSSNGNQCLICNPKIENGRYFLPDGSSQPFYVDSSGVLHNPDCSTIQDSKQ